MDFAKIISYLSGSRNSQFQGTPLKGCFWNNSSTRVVKIWKWLQNLSVEQCGVAFRKLLEKITKCSGTKRLWGSLSLVKLHAVHLEKNFSIYFFLENFKKCPEKKTKTFRKITNRACLDEYFYRYVLKVDKTYLQISLKTIFFKMLWADV